MCVCVYVGSEVGGGVEGGERGEGEGRVDFLNWLLDLQTLSKVLCSDTYMYM